MSFTKDEQCHIMPGTARSDHLVCAEPLCPTSSDPYTGRIICRCYQLPDPSRDQTPIHLTPSPVTSSYPGLYSHGYSLEATSPVSSQMLTPPGGRWDTSMFGAATGFPPTTFPPSTAPALPGQMENLLRSQMYSYMYPMLDINGARRKNATRETTSALKAWLSEHKKNPYPTKAEKIMLAIVTKMTLTQVSTWFANARRRLKKETKGGDWSPENSFENTTMSSDDDDRVSELGESDSTEQLEKRLGTGVQPINRPPSGSAQLPGFSTFSQFGRSSPNFLPGPLTMASEISSNMNAYGNHGITEAPTSYIKDDNSRLCDSNDSDKENSRNFQYNPVKIESTNIHAHYNVSGTTIESEHPHSEIPKPKIWSISNIIGAEVGKLDRSVTNNNSPAENSFAS